MIKVTFEFETAEAAAAFLEDSAGVPLAGVVGAVAAPAVDKRGRGRPRKEVAPVVDPTPAAAVPTAPAPAAPAVATAPATPSVAAVPFAALVDPLTKLADIDLDKALGILGQFGVKKASELKPEQFGPVLALVNAALATPAKQSLI